MLIGRDLKDLLLNNQEWESVQNIITILQPFKKYSKKVQSDEATLTDFFGYWTVLRIKLSKAPDTDNLSSCLLQRMNQYHATLMENPLIIAAMYLNPSHQRGLVDKKNMAIDFLCSLHKKILEVESTGSDQTGAISAIETSTHDNSSFDELEEYLEACASISTINNFPRTAVEEPINLKDLLEGFCGIKMPHNLSILEFWEKNKLDMPDLYKLATTVFAVPPTQASVERAFSALALVILPRRTNLSDETMQQILLIRLNS